MLLTLNHVKLLTVVCFLHIVGKGQCFFLQPYSVDVLDGYGGCKDYMPNFIYQLQQIPIDQAFELILEPLNVPSNPQDVQAIRTKLLSAIANGQLNVDHVLPGLNNLPINNKYELLISTLMAISEYVDKDCSIDEDLNKTIIYLLKKKYLGRSDLGLEGKFGRCASSSLQETPNFDCSISANSKSCECRIGSVIELFLNKLIQVIQEKQLQIFVGPQPTDSPTRFLIPRQLEPDILLQILNIIPKPHNKLEWTMYKKILELMRSEEVQKIIQSMDLSKYKSKQEMLNVILTTIKQTTTKQDLQQTLNFYIVGNQSVSKGFNFAELISVLPLPKSPKETQYYELVKQFLMSKEIYILLQELQLELKDKVNLPNLLIKVIKHLTMNKTLSSALMESLNYYLYVLEGKREIPTIKDLIVMLPKPTSSEDLTYFNVLKSLLESNEIYVLVHNAGVLSNISNKQDLLEQILFTLVRKSSDQSIVSAAKYFINVSLVNKFGFNYFKLLDLLNLPEKDQQYRDVLEQYMYTLEFEQILSKLNLSSLPDDQKLLLVLNAILTSTSNENVLKVIHIIIRDIDEAQFFKVILRILGEFPPPKSDEEKARLLIIRQFLTSEDGYNLLHNIDRSLFPDDKLLAEYIFKMVVGSNLASNIIEAFKYYYDVIGQIDEVEFVTKKEITKNFKLHEIFSDALDVHNLSLVEKEAFITFYKYITKVNPHVISNFKSWDKAKTRGEFVKYIFDYFLHHNEIPVDIKSRIMILLPLVRMDGKAALPP